MPASCQSLAGQEGEWRRANRPTSLPMSGTTEDRQQKMDGPARRHGESHALKVDERLRLARERREEYQKQLASREQGWLAREERARRYYEKHLEERRRKLEEQRLREERRRMAVEEKRKQRLKEERERYESVVLKTMERSQKAKQRSVHSSHRGNRLCRTLASRRTLTKWERNLISRLQTPTVSFLARSRSVACLSREAVVHVCPRSASCHSVSSNITQKHRSSPGQQRPTGASNLSGDKHQRGNRAANGQPLSLGSLERRDLKKLQPQTANAKVRPASKSQNRRALPPQGPQSNPPLRQSTNPEVMAPLPEEENPVPERMVSSSISQTKESASPPRGNNRIHPNPDPPEPHKIPTFSSQTVNGSCQHSPGEMNRPSAGTTDPEEATRLLAEKRRQARQQREREEEERRQREETERRRREELARRRAEERARLEAEAQLLEEKKRKDEEEQRQTEEEIASRQREEDRRLQQQREEEEARQKLIAEQQRLEREKHFQREEAERQERKKRLEEIMKRTRKIDPADMKSAPPSSTANHTLSNENAVPTQNGPLEDVIGLPGKNNSSKLCFADGEDMVPTVAFKERRSLRTLAGLDDIQAHQRAGELSHPPSIMHSARPSMP
ncbi:ensconsin [Chanos chanos]|uniref:Ensconsin n=1 Tax=Chanos chanos TaxID=29144 RepID=A0A6J2WK59_CHACN|nr:ensconsin-like [Chanos chanos]